MSTSKCFVPGCHSGYKKDNAEKRSKGERLNSLFQPPKDKDLFKRWEHTLKRVDRSLTYKDKVCDLHFEEKYIVKYFETKMPDGKIERLEREKWALVPGAIPTKFDFPKHLLPSVGNCKVKSNYNMVATKCFVPGCYSGYAKDMKERKEKGLRLRSMFRPPKDANLLELWANRIKRVDRPLTQNDRVCDLHFEDHFIIKVYETKMPDGSIYTIERRNWILAPGAVPTKFNFPQHLLPRKRKRLRSEDEKDGNDDGISCGGGDASTELEFEPESDQEQQYEPELDPESVLEHGISSKAPSHFTIEDTTPSTTPSETTECEGALTIEDISNLETTLTSSWSFLRLSNGSIMLAQIDTQDYSVKKRIVIDKNMKALVFIGLVLVEFEGNEYVRSLAQFDTLLMLTESANPCPNAFSKKTDAVYPCRGYTHTEDMCMACYINESVTYDKHDSRLMTRDVVPTKGLPPGWFSSLLPNDSAMMAFFDSEGDSAAISKRIHLDSDNTANQMGITVYLGLVKVGLEGFDTVSDVDTLQRLVRIVDEMMICSNAFYKTSVEREHPCLGYRVRGSICVTCSLEIDDDDRILKSPRVSKWEVARSPRKKKSFTGQQNAKFENSSPDSVSDSRSSSDSSDSDEPEISVGNVESVREKGTSSHVCSTELEVVTSGAIAAVSRHVQDVSGSSKCHLKLQTIPTPSNNYGRNTFKETHSRPDEDIVDAALSDAFENYEKARLLFAQTMADMALRSVNVDCMLRCNAMELLQALLNDPSLRVQQNAALAIGRLANNSHEAARIAVFLDVLPALLKNIEKRSKYYKKAAMFALRCMAKHSPDLANTLVSSGALEAILICLEEFDSGVKEAAVWAIGYIARHNTTLAQACVSAGVLPMLQLSLQEPEVCLKQISASAIGDIAKHDPTLAQAVCDAGCIMILAKCVNYPSPRLKKHAMCALSHVAKHSLNLAEAVVETDVVPDVILHLGHPDSGVQKSAANLLCELVKHHYHLAQLVINSGGIGALLNVIQHGESDVIFPAVLAIGYLAGQSDFMALAVKAAKGVDVLNYVLNKEKCDHVLATIAWAIGQLGKHSPDHTEEIAKAKIFPKLLEIYMDPKSSENLRQKTKGALKLTLSMCTVIAELEPLLDKAPPEILKYVLAQYSQILPNDPRARRMFVESGCLARIQAIQAEPGSSLMELISIVNHCFPEEIIRYYSPGYPETFVEAVENYKPTVPAMFAKEHDEAEDSEIFEALKPPLKSEYEVC